MLQEEQSTSSVEIWKCDKMICCVRLTHLSFICYSISFQHLFWVWNIWWFDVCFEREIHFLWYYVTWQLRGLVTVMINNTGYVLKNSHTHTIMSRTKSKSRHLFKSSIGSNYIWYLSLLFYLVWSHCYSSQELTIKEQLKPPKWHLHRDTISICTSTLKLILQVWKVTHLSHWISACEKHQLKLWCN